MGILEGEKIVIQGAREHNLKNISVRFPENCISTVCGVSGSGKSSLVMDEILPLMEAAYGRGERRKKARLKAIFPDTVKEVLAVDQSPISGTKLGWRRI